jgi:hypothetical protein
MKAILFIETLVAIYKTTGIHKTDVRNRYLYLIDRYLYVVCQDDE